MKFTRVELLLIGLVFLSFGVSAFMHIDKKEALMEVAESNRQVAEETRQLTEAVHANNHILEMIEGVE